MSAPRAQTGPEIWQILQLSDALDLEFASVLADFAPVVLWQPVARLSPLAAFEEEEQKVSAAPRLTIRTFPRVRGYARLPLPVISRTGRGLAARLAQQTPSPEHSVLLCTTPFFAPVAERWPGPVVYWLTDLIARYGGATFDKVRRLDQRMCRAATLVCPNSEKIANYLHDHAGCPTAKCEVLPNATGARSILPAPLFAPAALPAPYVDLPRPLAGVIGNLAGNTDWIFLENVLRSTPWLFWLFVGPTTNPVQNTKQRRARERVLRHDRSTFTGQQPYTELYKYARGLDVAVLPYRLREPTFSGSSTRFYDHLAACHPILATTAVAALRNQEPLLRLVSDAEAAAGALHALRAAGFQDGLREIRWQASVHQTWRHRAQTMMEMLQHRLMKATERG